MSYFRFTTSHFRSLARLVALIAIVLLATPHLNAQQNKAYRVEGAYQIKDVFDFECDGLYYEFNGDNEVNLVREQSVLVRLTSETIYRENVWKDAYYFEPANVFYTGDVVIPDSVMYDGKKYKVRGINQYALSFSRGLKSVTFPSDVNLESWRDGETGSLFYDQDLERIELPDSMRRIENQVVWASSLNYVHFPYKLESVENSFNHTGLREIDLDNHGTYTPTRFSVVNSFDYSPNLEIVKFPKCETLWIDECAFRDCFKMEQLVFRPCNTIIFPSGLELFYILYHILDYPLKVVSENSLPPTVPSYYRSPEYRSKMILYVPDESIEAYGAAEYWKDFGEIRPMSQYIAEEAAAIESVADDSEESAEVTVSSTGAEMRVEVSAPAEVTVWSLQGQPVWRGAVSDEVTLTLPKDVYIITTPSSARKYRH